MLKFQFIWVGTSKENEVIPYQVHIVLQHHITDLKNKVFLVNTIIQVLY